MNQFSVTRKRKIKSIFFQLFSIGVLMISALLTESAYADRDNDERESWQTERKARKLAKAEERAERLRLFDAERGFRKGAGGRRGNENSVRPPRLPRVAAPIEKDRQRESDDSKMDPARNGCPEGSFALTFAPDGMSFSILFDKFIAETSTQKNDVMRCHLIVPVDVPENTRMTITRLDYRGFVSLPAGSVGVLRSTYAFQGKRNGAGPGNRGAYAVSLTQKFMGPIAPEDQNYTISSDAFTDRQAVSGCGGVNNLRISNVVRINNKGKTPQQATLTLDSVDGELQYYVSYEKCTN